MARRPYPPARGLMVPGAVMYSAPSVEPLADVSTPNLDLTQPEVGASSSTWGYKLNTNFTILDGAIVPASKGGSYAGAVTFEQPTTQQGSGITYSAFSTHAIGFGWDGNVGAIAGYVDGSYVGDFASLGWVNANFPTYGWMAGNYLNKAGDTCTGNLFANGAMGGGGGVFADFPSNDFGLYRANGNDRIINFTAGYYFRLSAQPADAGYMYYVAQNQVMAQWRWTGDYVIAGQGWKPGGGSWAASSDRRVKRSVTDYRAGLAAVCALRPIRYKYNGLGGTINDDHYYFGLIAQEARDSMPELVGAVRARLDRDDPRTETDLLTLDSTPLIFALVNCCRELAERVAKLEGRNGNT